MFMLIWFQWNRNPVFHSTTLYVIFAAYCSYLKTVPILSLNSLLSLINLLGIFSFIIKGNYRVKLTLAIVKSASLIKMYQGNFFFLFFHHTNEWWSWTPCKNITIAGPVYDIYIIYVVSSSLTYKKEVQWFLAVSNPPKLLNYYYYFLMV